MNEDADRQIRGALEDDEDGGDYLSNHPVLKGEETGSHATKEFRHFDPSKRTHVELKDLGPEVMDSSSKWVTTTFQSSSGSEKPPSGRRWRGRSIHPP